jgi:hypothetical protein
VVEWFTLIGLLSWDKEVYAPGSRRYTVPIEAGSILGTLVVVLRESLKIVRTDEFPRSSF